MKIPTVLLSAILLLLLSPFARAEQFVQDDKYIVHYSAFNSTMLTPEVAKTYDLMRSRQRAIMNISVMRKMPDGSNKAVMSQVEGFTGALGGSERKLDFKVITEGTAVYYLAEFLIGNGEQLNFDIKVKPTPEYSPIKVEFTQAFYTEE
ncbi:MAG TPA: DUF4426 domain-containing protein [Dongiaceae bacterium]|nr:DUF4426 domain-containing protein [Dongiaceae bacterium]